MTLITHKEFLPSFGLGKPDQEPVCIYTVLSVNSEVGDCAAYRGIGTSNADDAMIERIRGGGQKISEREARELFPEMETDQLRYRR